MHLAFCSDFNMMKAFHSYLLLQEGYVGFGNTLDPQILATQRGQDERSTAAFLPESMRAQLNQLVRNRPDDGTPYHDPSWRNDSSYGSEQFHRELGDRENQETLDAHGYGDRSLWYNSDPESEAGGT